MLNDTVKFFVQTSTRFMVSLDAASLIMFTLVFAIVTSMLPVLFWTRFVVLFAKWFTYMAWAFALLISAFIIFFATEILEFYDIPETLEAALNMLSTLLLLGGQTIIIIIFWKGR